MWIRWAVIVMTMFATSCESRSGAIAHALAGDQSSPAAARSSNGSASDATSFENVCFAMTALEVMQSTPLPGAISSVLEVSTCDNRFVPGLTESDYDLLNDCVDIEPANKLRERGECGTQGRIGQNEDRTQWTEWLGLKCFDSLDCNACGSQRRGWVLNGDCGPWNECRGTPRYRLLCFRND